MANDLEKQSTDTPEDVLPYAFIEDALSEEDVLDSDGQEALLGRSHFQVPLPIRALVFTVSGPPAAAFLANGDVACILANATFKIPLAKAHNNHRLGV